MQHHHPTPLVICLLLALAPAAAIAATPVPAAEPTYRQVPIPLREHGYQPLTRRVIRTREGLERLLDQAAQQDGWNDRSAFHAALVAANVDFDHEALVLLPHQEPSGSNRITPQLPMLADGVVTWTVVRAEPEVGTADMAYYALALVVDLETVDRVVKQVATVDHREVVNLQALETHMMAADRTAGEGETAATPKPE